MIINEHLYKRLMDKHGSMEAVEAFLANRNTENTNNPIQFIGVAKDFNYNSTHEAIGDYAILIDESINRARFIHIRLKPGDIRTSLDKISEIWSVHYGGQKFKYFFIDEKIAQQYKAETTLLKILFVFSILGILISIIGVSALSLFISQQRTKEIGIRKTNGAQINEILVLLNLDFVKWVSIAFIIAGPISFYAMKIWLQNFAYKTELSWWIFALSGAITLGITILAVSWQSWHAATKNPVEALRYE